MTQMHFAQKQEGWFGPTRTYVRVEDIVSWLEELAEKHEARAKEARQRGYENSADDYEVVAKWLKIHKTDFVLTLVG
jgi:hypothetical protein